MVTVKIVYLVNYVKTTFLILTILSLSSCSPLKSVENKEFVFSIRKTECYGTCPVYEMKIYTNGIVTLNAERFMDIEGLHYSNLSKSELERLKQLFDDSEYFSLKEEYLGHVSDLPTTYTSYNNGKTIKSVMNYYGGPESLHRLEDELEALVDKLSWKQ